MSWLSRFNTKKTTKRPVTIIVEPQHKRKTRKSGPQHKPEKQGDNKVACNGDIVQSNSNGGSRNSDPRDFADWMKSTGIVTAVYEEPNVEEYEYGIFTFNFPLLRTDPSEGVTIDVVAAHMVELQILGKKEEALLFCRSIAGDNSTTITASEIVGEAKGSRKYNRIVCKRYIKAVYNQQIEGILSKPTEDVSDVPSPLEPVSRISSVKAWALGNTATGLQRKYSRADSGQPGDRRASVRRLSSHSNRDTILNRIVSRVSSRAFSRQYSNSVSERSQTPAAKKSSAVTLGIAKRIREKETAGTDDDELTPEQKKQVEDFLKSNGYDEF
jgi:hypothetical protein